MSGFLVHERLGRSSAEKHIRRRDPLSYSVQTLCTKIGTLGVRRVFKLGLKKSAPRSPVVVDVRLQGHPRPAAPGTPPTRSLLSRCVAPSSL